MRWSAKYGHKRRQRRGSGEQSILYSQGHVGKTLGWSGGGGRREQPLWGLSLEMQGRELV